MMVIRTLVTALFVFGASGQAPADEPEKAGAGTREESIEHGGLKRTYRIHVPPSYDGSKEVPLVLMFHAGGGSGQSAERNFGFSRLSDQEGFLVVYPDGIAHQLNDGRIGERFAKVRGVDDVNFIRALIEHLAQSHKIDRRRIYATGFSNGGFLSHRLGCELYDTLAAIASVAGTLDPRQAARFAPKHPVHVLQIHGTKDVIVPYEGGAVAGDAAQWGQCIPASAMITLWVIANGCKFPSQVEDLPENDPNDGTSLRRETYAPGERGAEVVLYTIKGQGHNWAGRPAPSQVTGPSTTEIEAAPLIWEFFKTHPKGSPDAVGESGLREEFKALIAGSRDVWRRYGDGLKQLKTEGERRAYIKANWPPEKDVVGPMIELARRHPEDPTAFDALAWVAILGYGTAQSDTAAEILARRHGPDKRLWLICQDMRRGVISPSRGILLRAVLEDNPDRTTRGRACLDLAEYRTELANFARLLKAPGLRPWHAQAYGAERLDWFRALDPAELEREAERLYRRVLDEFADVAPLKWWTVPRMRDLDPRSIYEPNQDGEPDAGTLADRAQAALDELRRLGLGRVAPEIEGQDVDGHRFKLSDYRDRVVVLTFSGTWCGPCKAMYPHQREIVARLTGRPFALLSVMTDEQAEPIRKETASGEITWRCWWERGGTHGPIPAAWNVRAYPTVYVIDHKGVIRLKFTGHLAAPEGTSGPQPPIDAFLDGLLKEQEEDGSTHDRRE
jgi:polyhydroxybutyrate depolymerase